MITSDLSPASRALPQVVPQRNPRLAKLRSLHQLMWVCLCLACLGTSWFVYQCNLVPQAISYAPDWQGARWIQSSDATSSVAYFRYTTSISTIPDGAFVTIAASQVFHLSINGFAVNNNFKDFEQGVFPQTYMYQIDTLLKPGPNVFAVVVSNFNEQVPALRMSIGFVRGTSVSYMGTGVGNTQWQSTGRTDIVYPHYSSGLFFWNIWTTATFDSSSWSLAASVQNTPASSMLPTNPLVYEQPVATHWMSAGLAHEAYFVRHFSIPFGVTAVWLRIIAVGGTNVFINGHASIVWDGQPVLINQDESRYLSDNSSPVRYQSGLILGVYNIAAFLQTGENTIAVRVASPSVQNALTGLDSLNATIALDMIVDDVQGNHWVVSENGWHASPKPVDGWTQGSSAAFAWSQPIIVGRPGLSGTSYAQRDNSQRDVQIVPFTRIMLILLFCFGAVVGLWLFMALVVMRRYYRSRSNALETLSLAYLPALACEALLMVLSHDPHLSQPFPYTWQWELVLVVCVALGYLVLWASRIAVQKQRADNILLKKNAFTTFVEQQKFSFSTKMSTMASRKSTLYSSLAWLFSLLRTHWLLLVILLIAAPLILYNIAYEPYWQDELTSLYAAKGILAHGIPVMPSGFIYPKGELYSYFLALWMAIFGDKAGVPRLLSTIEYLVSLPLMYLVSSYFFGRRIALLATAMLAFAPAALLWGRQARMYEQAQFFTLLSVYLIYRALQERQRVHLIYLAVGSLLLMYLSHEETFIVFPAIVSWVLFLSKDEKHRMFAVLYQKHWWIAGSVGAAIIGVQLLIVHFTHPPVLGTDQSQIPFIQFTTNNIPYYLRLLFAPWTLGRIVTLPVLTLNSFLAVVGCILAWRGNDSRAKYCAWFLLTSFLTLMLVFTLSSDRYLYPILPIYYLMGAFATYQILHALWVFARTHLLISSGRIDTPRGGYIARSTNIVVMVVTTVLVACILILPMLPLNDYNPAVSHAFNLSYHRHYPDYDGVGQYMQQHWQKGDTVIAIFPAISILYYVGHNDYFFSVDRALYLFEKNGQITDTPTGANPILNQDDFLTVLNRNARIWVISDNGSYQSQVQGRFTFPPEFHLVYQGYQSAIYLRGSLNSTT